jgi:homopolymeric O-antigen transport system permease protein
MTAQKADSLTSPHVTVIEPRRGWRALDLKELWAYRELLYVLTMRDIKVRYKQTVLGFSWAVIQPAMMMLVFSIFFGGLAKMPSDGYPYPLFVYSGLLPWTFFQTAVGSASNSLLNSSHLVTKVYFPRLMIPLSAIGSGLADFLIATLVLFVLMAIYGCSFGSNLLLAPFLILGVVFIALGVGTFLAALTVSYRDFRYVVPFMLQFWMFATPVIYPASLVPEKWRTLLYLNPMAGIIEGFRAAFLGSALDPGAVALSLFTSALIFAAGAAYFERVERRFADII